MKAEGSQKASQIYKDLNRKYKSEIELTKLTIEKQIKRKLKTHLDCKLFETDLSKLAE